MNRQRVSAAKVTLASFLGVVFGAYALALALDPALANHDVGWTISAAERLLDGAAFGEDVIDNNPPLIYWASMLVVALARILSLPVFVTYNLLVLSLAIGSALACRALVARVLDNRELLDTFAVVVAAILVVVPGYGFSQRDQIITVALMPCVLNAGLILGGRIPARGVRLAIGLGVGLACSLKPHYVLVWLVLEAMIILRTRRLLAWNRLENWSMAAFGITYLGSVVLAAPGYLRDARDALAVYHSYNNPVPLFSPQTAVLVLSVVVLAATRPGPALRWCAVSAAVAGAVGFLTVVAQQKNFDYHYILMVSMSLLVLVLALIGYLQPRLEWRLRWVAPAAVGLACLAVVSAWLTRESFEERRELADVIREHGEGRPVLYLSTSVDPLFPALVYTRSRSASPYSSLWHIAGNYDEAERVAKPFPYRSLREMPKLEREFVVGLVDRFEREQPELVFFDRSAAKQSLGFSAFEFDRYFRADPRFERLMEPYRSIGLVGRAAGFKREKLDHSLETR